MYRESAADLFGKYSMKNFGRLSKDIPGVKVCFDTNHYTKWNDGTFCRNHW